ncbi:MAG: NUDIX hydrolase [Betaproteobacteria bacterium]|nr:MAG: NUDIX hydrolase [Betaproteobacteria bacterium]
MRRGGRATLVKELTEHCLSGELVFDGKLLKVHRDLVRLPDGSQGAREYIRQVPAGKLEPDEPHLDTAKRELLEETGYTAAEWTRLGVIHTAIAYTDEAIELFLAKKLKKERAVQLDAGEFVETLIIPFDEAIAMVRDGRITDSKTVAALLWVRTWGGP